MTEKQIEVPSWVWVKLVREIWMNDRGVSLAQLLEGGREMFVLSLNDAFGEGSQFPLEVRRPTAEELGGVFDLLIREMAS